MITTGDTAPEFTLENTAGKEVNLSDSVGTGPVILLFFRGHWCSYCAEQLQTYSQHAYDLWRNYNTDVLAVAPNPIPELVEMRNRFELSIQPLSDPTLSVTNEYTSIEESEQYGRIPVASTFVIDSDRVVRYAQVASDPADRTYANFARHFIKGEYTIPYS